MFEAFTPAPVDVANRRRLAASASVAASTYVGIALAVGFLARGAEAIQEKMVDVTFEKQTPKKEVPVPIPPPPPPVVKKVERPRIAAPPPPTPQAPPPPPPLQTIVPKVLPKEAPQEADPSLGRPAFVMPEEGLGGGARRGVPGGTGHGAVGTAAVAAVAARAAGPVNLPEEATPPSESPDNRPPDYPEDARAAGKEGLVILKIVVTEQGTVGDIKVMKGDPPFVEAAVSRVKTWRYKAALLDGHPIAVFRIVKVPFRLGIGARGG